MKKSRMFFVAVLCMLFTSAGLLANNNPIEINKDLRNEIVQMVQKIDTEVMTADYERAYVQFLVNAENEIVVLSVTNDDLELDIKSQLNYKKIKTEGVKKNVIFTVPVTFQKKPF